MDQLADPWVLPVDQSVGPLHNGDLAPEADEQLPQLDPDRATPDHDRPSGYRAQLGRLPVGPHLGLVQALDRRVDRVGSGGQDHVLGREPLPVHLDPATPLQVFGGGTLVFDQFGRAKLHIFKRLDGWARQVQRLEYLHKTGLYDRSGRLGFSYGEARGQAFAELHNSDPGSGEAW